MAKKKLTKTEKPYTDTLMVQLTDEEMIETAEGLARALDSIGDLEQEKKAYNAEIKAQIEHKEAEARELTAMVRNKRKIAKVDCVEIRNYTTGRIKKVRKDTGETLIDREMNHDEKQQKLCDQEGPIDEEPGKISFPPVSNFVDK